MENQKLDKLTDKQYSEVIMNSPDMLVATIDVGINTGIAYWKDGKLIHQKLIQAPKKLSQHEKMDYLYHQMSMELIKYEPDLVVLEGVSVWGDDEKSNIAAKSGSLTFLSYITGMYQGLCIQQNLEYRTILFREWGGQLKADIIRKRVEKQTGVKFAGTKYQHVYDAIGMGLALQGRL